jgi:hypothetical protein
VKSVLDGLDDANLGIDALRVLVEADHHLHKREEQAWARDRLKSVLNAQQHNVIRNNTVDVLDFRPVQ